MLEKSNRERVSDGLEKVSIVISRRVLRMRIFLSAYR